MGKPMDRRPGLALDERGALDTGMNLVRTTLRDVTRVCHERVDAAFGGFALDERSSYGGFLLAHASVLPGLESALAQARLWSGWHPRAQALLEDLQDLGLEPPTPIIETPVKDEAALWGVLYVLEGSRLGGGILAGRVGQGLPRRYLSMRHQDGSWRAFEQALEAAGSGDGDWLKRAMQGAVFTFDKFEQSALRFAGSLAPTTA